MSKKNMIAGLGIGRSQMSMVAKEMDNNMQGGIAASKAPCMGNMKNGAVIDLDSATEIIVKLLEETNQKSSKTVSSVFVNISGLDIKQELASTVMTLPHRGCEITQKHIDDLIQSCKIVSIPMERYLLYLFPLEYIIDGQEGVKNPIGLCGTRLEAKVLIITSPFNQVQNIIKAVNFAGLEVEKVILTALANAYSLLGDEERREGVLLIDLKTDFTEISIFKNDSLLFFKTIPRGQEDITNEIAMKFNISFELAEELKLQYGFLDNTQQDSRNQETIPLEWMGNKQNITRGEINRIIGERLGLIFDLILQEIKDFKGFNNVAKAGAVISGGATFMDGLTEWVGQRLGFKIRPGVLKQDLGALEYSYSTSLGLLKFGLRQKASAATKTDARFYKRIFQKTGELLSDYF